MSLKWNIFWLAYINGIELHLLFEQVIAIWLVGFNLTFDVHKKAWTFILLNPHYTFIMALAFRIVVNKKKTVTYCQQAIVKVFIKCSLHCLLNILYAFFYVIICVYTCRKPVVLEKQFFLFMHVLDLNLIFANQDPPSHFKTKKFLHLPLPEP